MTTALLLVAGLARAQGAARRDAELIRAAEAGDAQAVKRLLAEGASVQARDVRGRTALVAATYGNRVEAARLLIAAGVDVNARDGLRNSAFRLARANGYPCRALRREAVSRAQRRFVSSLDAGRRTSRAAREARVIVFIAIPPDSRATTRPVLPSAGCGVSSPCVPRWHRAG